MKNYKPIIDFLFPASRELKKPRITLNHKPTEDYSDDFKGHASLLAVTYLFDQDTAVVAAVGRANRDINLLKIRFDGSVVKMKEPSDIEWSILDSLNKDVIKTLRTYGHKGGFCCICRATLDDPRSLAVGYGPVCAGKWGLPWTKQEVAEFERKHDVDWNIADEIDELDTEGDDE